VSTEQETDRGRFREAMASFPSGATIVTTSDAAGDWWGFTASSFCSVSLEPPLVLTCLARGAQCFPAFAEAERWNIHVLQHRHAGLALRFATRGADKFGGAGFVADERGLPVLPDASVVLRCASHSKVEGGDHLVLIGQVEEAGTGSETPFVYFRRRFHSLGHHIDQADDGERRLAPSGHAGADQYVALGSAAFEVGIGWG
jgi:flavin reductase ActVB